MHCESEFQIISKYSQMCACSFHLALFSQIGCFWSAVGHMSRLSLHCALSSFVCSVIGIDIFLRITLEFH